MKSNTFKKPIIQNETINELDFPFVCYFDGAILYNPYGDMGIGGVVYENGELIDSGSMYFPASVKNSNNVAEFIALQWVLSSLINKGLQNENVLVCGDSLLVINIMSNRRGIGIGYYTEYAEICKTMASQFKNIKFKWIPREENDIADELSKEELRNNIGNDSPHFEHKNLPYKLRIKKFEEEERENFKKGFSKKHEPEVYEYCSDEYDFKKQKCHNQCENCKAM
jgi:ribonuclease HI